MINSMEHDIILAIWERPPTVCWIRDLLKDAENGIHEKNDPTILLTPYDLKKKYIYMYILF